MIEDLVHNHRNPSAVTAVYELAEFIRRTVVFIQRHVKRRVVSPAQVSLKLRIWHKLNGIHPKTLNVIQRIDQRLVIARSHKIADEQFVDKELLLWRGIKSGVGPIIY